MECFIFGCLTPFLILVAIAVSSANTRKRLAEEAASQAAEARRRTEAAHQEYREALDWLRQKPTDPIHRQRALDLGRAYSALTRNGTNVTIYDEVAIKNDIDAATASTVHLAVQEGVAV